jgi:alginate O-acetyltransferase complex protein AlgI
MLFNSLAFVFFLPIVFIGFLLLPIKWRSAWLLLASYYFYFSWSYWMGCLLLATTLFDWWMGLKIDATQNNKKTFLYLSLFFNLGLLIGFKYLGAFSNFTTLFDGADFKNYNTTLNAIAIPIGISFYTFQSLSYVLDVYKQKIKAEKNLLTYALFVAFFPQLVAGPIERFQHLKKQFTFSSTLKTIDFRSAIQNIISGFFKKLVIADRVGEYVDVVFQSPATYHPLLLLLAGFGFAVQVNCDFSGYTDIATGVAKLFGVDLMTNFKRPLLASSFKSFWQRHHISFMNWFRDYAYLPLGGNKKGHLIWIRNVFIVFLLSGFWHGAKLNLLVWGFLLAAIYLIENIFINKYTALWKKIVGIFYFLLLHSLLILLVRSPNWETSKVFYSTIFSPDLFHAIDTSILLQQLNTFTLTITMALVLLFFTKEILDERQAQLAITFSKLAQNALYFFLFLLIFIAGRFDTNLFIYFQF